MIKLLESMGVSLILNDKSIKVSTKNDVCIKGIESLDTSDEYTQNNEDSIFHLYKLSDKQKMCIEFNNDSVDTIKTIKKLSKVTLYKYWEIDDSGEFELIGSCIRDNRTGRTLKTNQYVNGELYSSEVITVDDYNNLKSIRSSAIEDDPRDTFQILYRFSYNDGKLYSIRKLVNEEHVSTIKFFYNSNSKLRFIKYFHEGLTCPVETIEFRYGLKEIIKFVYAYDVFSEKYRTVDKSFIPY